MTPEDEGPGPPWEALLDVASDLLTVHDRDGRVRLARGAVRQVLGTEPADLEGTVPFALIHREDRGRVVSTVLRLRDRPGAVAALAFRAAHVDGSWRWLEAVVSNRLADRRVRGIVVASRDATAHREADEALRASEERYRQLVVQAPHGVLVVTGTDAVVRFANPAAARIAGVADRDAAAPRLADWLHPADRERCLASVRAALHGGRPPPDEYRARSLAGGDLQVLASALPYTWGGEPAALLMLQDVTALRRAQRDSERTSARWRALLDASTDGLLGVGADGRLTFVNTAAAEMLGLDPSAALGQVEHELVHHTHADGSPYDEQHCPIVRAARGARRAEVTGEVFWRADGTGFPVEYRTAPLEARHGAGALVTFRDVTERQQAQQRLASVAALQRAVLDSLPAQTAVLDENGIVVAVNAAWTAVMLAGGGTPERCGVGADFFAVCDAAYGPAAAEARAAAEGVRAVLDGRLDRWSTALTVHVGDAPPSFFDMQVVPLRSHRRGVVLGYVDVTEQRRLQELAMRRATHDPLTGLANRTLLLDRLAHALARRDVGTVVVLLLDVDQFGLVNDGYGLAAGDAVLREVGERLARAVRPSDTVARLAGDEFVVVFEPRDDSDDSMVVAERLRRVLDEPLQVDDTGVPLSCSIGVALVEMGYDAEDALRAADQARAVAKSRGRGQLVVFEDGVHGRSRERLEQAIALRQLVDEDRLAVHYQPVVDLQDGRVVGVEALLRWHGESLLPDTATAVALAEEVGLVQTIGRWVLSRACNDAARFPRPAGRPLSVAVNLAPQQIGEALPADVVEALADSGLPASSLTLEITERTVVADLDEAVSVLADVRRLGVRVAVDDFGVGHSSLAYLRDLPLDAVKIDASFVRTMHEGPEGDRLVRAIVDLAHGIGLDVVAEGVEEEGQRRTLLELGCRRGQGWLFGRPGPADAVGADAGAAGD